MEDLRKAAWEAYLPPILEERGQVMDMLDEIGGEPSHAAELTDIKAGLAGLPNPFRRDDACRRARSAALLRDEDIPAKQVLATMEERRQDRINSDATGRTRTAGKALQVEEIQPVYSDQSPTVMGYEVINAGFDASCWRRDPRVIAFGEDVGKLGDVNQGFKGLQEKYGEWRVVDTGIREATILGQAIGMAMRGLRPICEIQYLDYSAVCAANHVGRSGHPALAHGGRPEARP